MAVRRNKTSKKCSRCGKKKPLNRFEFRAGTYRSTCRDCRNAAKRQVYDEKRDDPTSIARRILKGCKEREKGRLAKLLKRLNGLSELPNVELTKEQFDLDVEWVLKQRDLQSNRCYYTGIDMIWSTGLIENRRIDPSAVTVERLDSAKGYVKENCVLACWWSNCAKASGTVEEMIHFSACIVSRSTILKRNAKRRKR